MVSSGNKEIEKSLVKKFTQLTLLITQPKISDNYSDEYFNMLPKK